MRLAARIALRVAVAVAAAGALAGGGAAVRQESWCTSACRFTFCPDSWGYYDIVGQTDESFTNAICDTARDEWVGIVGRTGEAHVQVGRGVKPISAWRPDGLSMGFPESFFKSFTVDGIHSGVGRQVAHGNQLGYLNRTCFELPLIDYQRISWNGKTVLENKHVEGNEREDCVAFMTSV